MEGEESMDEHERSISPSTSKGKAHPTSGFYAKASDTRIVRQVLHAHAMLDSEETEGQDLTLKELPFHLLVAGEI